MLCKINADMHVVFNIISVNTVGSEQINKSPPCKNK